MSARGGGCVWQNMQRLTTTMGCVQPSEHIKSFATLFPTCTGCLIVSPGGAVLQVGKEDSEKRRAEY